MHDDVQAAELVGNLLECGLHVVVRANVALYERRVLPGSGQLGDAILHTLALIGDGDSRPGLMKNLGDSPRDAALICDAEDDAVLARQVD